MTDFLAEIFESVNRNRSRAITSGIGVAWGIFILMLLIGVGNGFESGVFNLFSGFSQNATYVYAGKISQAYKNAYVGKILRFEKKDLNYISHNVAEINKISPEITNWQMVSCENKCGNFNVCAVTPDYFDIKLLSVGNGRLLNMLDTKNARNVALIGENVEEILLVHKNPIGSVIKIGDNNFTIVGVIKNTMLTAQEMRQIYIPYTTYLKTNADAKYFQTMVFSGNSSVSAFETNNRVRNFLARKYQFAPNDKTALYFNSLEDQVKAFNSFFNGLNSFLWFMGISTLISGVIGIGNIMYSTVKERTREIGIRKSLGASSQQIKKMFIVESVMITTLAGIIGMIMGWGVLKLLALIIGNDSIVMSEPHIDLFTAIAALLVLVFSGVLAGLKPAIYASELNPIDALRVEN